MNDSRSMAGVRMRWLALGILLGVLGGGSVFWLRGDADIDAAATPTSDMAQLAMSGMDMGQESMPGLNMGQGAMPGMDMSAQSMSGVAQGMQMPGGGTVRLSPTQVRHFGVTFATVEERPLETSVRTVGVVEVDETRLVEVVTKFPGYVDRLYADFTGKVVREGESLLDVYAPELVAAQEEILLARALQGSVGVGSIPGITTPVVDLEATARRRLTLWDISDDQIGALLTRGEPSRTLSLQAPITGTILEKSVVAGGAFRAGEMLFRMADLSTVWVIVEIRESDAALVDIGSTATVTLTSYPGERFSGIVEFVYPTVDERTRSVRARVVLPNSAGRLRPGMFATVVITTPRRSALSVPADAVVWTGERTLLFVVGDDGGIRPVEVELGPTVGDQAVVLTGLTSGETVVSAAQYLIDAEANIGAIMRSMMSMMGSGDMAGMDMEGMDMDMPSDTLSRGR